jgi:hypothetical protein
MKNTFKSLVSTVSTNVRNYVKFSSTLALGVVMLSCSDLENSIDVSPETTSNSRAKTMASPTELNIDYQNYIVGNYYQYTSANATSDFISVKGFGGTASTNLTVKIWDLPNYYKALRVKMPKDGGGVNESGMVIDTYLADKNEYTMEYKVFFEDGFEFNRGNTDVKTVNGVQKENYGGGKLPGLTGGSNPSGCSYKSDGMSSRIMFRREKSKRSTPNGGYLELYQYWQDQADKGGCGDRIILQDVVDNTWYTIKMKVNLGTINTNGTTNNGFVKIWVNGVSRLDKAFKFRKDQAKWNLNGIMFHSFMGGNDDTWAPTQDRYLMIDNVKVDDNAF